MWTRVILNAFIAMMLVLSAAGEAAPLVNGGFETGDLTGWDCGAVFGGATALSSLAAPSVGPTQGSYMVILSNGGGPSLNHGLPLGATNCGGAGDGPSPLSFDATSAHLTPR